MLRLGTQPGNAARRYLQQTCSKKLTLTCKCGRSGVPRRGDRRRRLGLIWLVCVNFNWIALACRLTLGRYECEGNGLNSLG